MDMSTPAWMEKVAAAKVSSTSDRAPFPLLGDYVVEVEKIRTGKTFKTKHEYVVVEARVKESNNPSQPAGSIVGVYFDLDDEYEYGPRDFKAFTAAVLGITADDVGKDVLATAYSDNAEAVLGTEVHLRSHEKVKEDGGRIPLASWAAYRK